MKKNKGKRQLCIGDVHGNYIGLMAALNRAAYDPEKDHLTFLGDICDGYPDTKAVMDFILEHETKPTLIMGNHDLWFNEFLKSKEQDEAFSLWFNQGGKETLKSFGIKSIGRKPIKDTILVKGPRIADKYINFFDRAFSYLGLGQEDGTILKFVHGGFPLKGDKFQIESDYSWDRRMWQFAYRKHPHFYQEQNDVTIFNDKSTIFIGHSNVHDLPGNSEALPLKRLNVWNLDTGGGWQGKITVMDVHTEEYWQSDFSEKHYPNFIPRK